MSKTNTAAKEHYYITQASDMDNGRTGLPFLGHLWLLAWWVTSEQLLLVKIRNYQHSERRRAPTFGITSVTSSFVPLLLLLQCFLVFPSVAALSVSFLLLVLVLPSFKENSSLLKSREMHEDAR